MKRKRDDTVRQNNPNKHNYSPYSSVYHTRRWKGQSLKKLLFVLIMMILPFGITGCSEKVTEVTMLTQWAHIYETNNYCERLIEEAFPIDIKIGMVDISNTEQVRALLETDVPDFFVVDEIPTYIHGNGYARTIPVDMVREYAPSLMKYFDEYPLLYATALSQEDPTQFTSLIGIDETSTRIALYADMYRYDWILESGIDIGVPVIQLTENYYVAQEGLSKETFEEIMEYFVYGDPDQNGLDDTMGASMYGTDIRTTLMSGFGIVPDVNELDGEAVQYYTMPEYKELVTWFVDLYDKGLIDEEWFTQDREKVWNKVEHDKTGFWQSSTNAMNAWAVGRPPITLIHSNPNAKILLTTGLKDDDGNVTMLYDSITMARKNYYIGADVSDEKLELILQMYEYCNFSDASMHLWFGEEGVDWQYNEENEFELLNELDVVEKGVKVFAQNTQVGELWEAITLEEDFLKGSEFWLDGGVWQQDYVYPYKADLRSESNYAVLLAEKGDAINSVVNSYFQAWLTGEKDVNLTWSEYLRELEDAGYEELIKELESVPTLYDIREEYQ
ncbi:MAG: hypothetical protein R3Y54_03605 [Eubacteriales bacterium]